MDEKLLKQLDKLENVLKAIDSDYITQQEFEDVMALVVASIETAQEDTAKRLNAMSQEDEKSDAVAYKAYTDALNALKTSLEAQISSIERVSKADVQEAINTAVAAVQAQKGDAGEPGSPGAPGTPGTPGKDGSPDTPDEVVQKVNQSKLLIAKERIEGFVDIMRNVAAQAAGAVGVTTTIFFKNGTQVGRAKNINIIEGNNVTATMYQTGDQMNVSLSTTGAGGLTWIADEVPTDSSDHTNFTIAHTPSSGTFKLFRGGAKQQGGGGDFTLTGTALVLNVALATGEILLCDYGF